VLPPRGFVVESRLFTAFSAKSWNGRVYLSSVLFTLKSLDGKDLDKASMLRILHGFGQPNVDWRGTTHEVLREKVLVLAG
jgi:hypothetical protein